MQNQMAIRNLNTPSFGNRYLVVERPIAYIGGFEHSERVLQAVEKSPVVQKFIEQGNPKSLWSRLLNYFKRNEYLEVKHVRGFDLDRVEFSLRKNFSKKAKRITLNADKEAVVQNPNYLSRKKIRLIPTEERMEVIKKHNEIMDDNLIEQISNIKSDFFSNLG